MARRYCIIGAGYTGLAVAKAYTDLGLDYDHVEATAPSAATGRTASTTRRT